RRFPARLPRCARLPRVGSRGAARMSNRLVRWGVYVLIAIAFAVGCAFLSNWQFDRNESRAEQLALVERNYDAAPVSLPDAFAADGAFDAADEWHPVLLQGEYL